MTKIIPGHPDYEIDEYGNVFSLKHGKRKQLKPSYKGNGIGYPAFSLRTNRRYCQKLAHLLVMETFIGPPPEGHEARHLDGNKHNSYIGNLAWGTRRENLLDRNLHGQGARGERNPQAKLTALDVINIRNEVKQGERGVLTRIANKYGVCVATIVYIRDRKIWAHLSGD